MAISQMVRRATLAVAASVGIGVLPVAADTIEIHNTMSTGGSEEAALQKFQELLAGLCVEL